MKIKNRNKTLFLRNYYICHTKIQIQTNMLERDYIKRLIRQFFEAIEKLKEKKAEKDHSMYRAYFLQPVSFFYEQDTEFILHYLYTTFQPEEVLQRVEMLSELFLYDASVESNPQTRKMLQKKGFLLLKHLDTHSNTFSFDRRRKMAELEQLTHE